MELHERIRACRIQSGMTQDQVAEALDVSRQAVTKWENGKSAPSTENLFRLAQLFGTTVDLILTEQPPKGKQQEENSESFAFSKNRNFWISVIFGSLIFFLINPYGVNMYIPVIFTFLCVMLNAWSVITMSLLLYRHLQRRPLGEDFGMYLGVLIIGALGHGIFSVMYWSSWFCLGLSLIFIIYILVKKWQETKKNNAKST